MNLGKVAGSTCPARTPCRGRGAESRSSASEGKDVGPGPVADRGTCRQQCSMCSIAALPAGRSSPGGAATHPCQLVSWLVQLVGGRTRQDVDQARRYAAADEGGYAAFVCLAVQRQHGRCRVSSHTCHVIDAGGVRASTPASRCGNMDRCSSRPDSAPETSTSNGRSKISTYRHESLTPRALARCEPFRSVTSQPTVTAQRQNLATATWPCRRRLSIYPFTITPFPSDFSPRPRGHFDRYSSMKAPVNMQIKSFLGSRSFFHPCPALRPHTSGTWPYSHIRGL